MVRRILNLLRHWRETKTALSTLSFLYDSNSDALDVLGGLTDEEMQAVCSWASSLTDSANPSLSQSSTPTIVEVGTLFGLTAREIDRRMKGGRVIAVDNFSWNPFGLPPIVHENFTRSVLKGSGVELVNASSHDWRSAIKKKPDMIFFDADHRYEAVKEELLWAKAQGIKIISGHDYGNSNPRFGVTRAVDEVFGNENVKVVGMCWMVKQ